MEVSHKLKLELLNDSAIPTIGIHSKDSNSPDNRDTYTSIFRATLFAIARK